MLELGDVVVPHTLATIYAGAIATALEIPQTILIEKPKGQKATATIATHLGASVLYGRNTDSL